ncbi:2-phosphosulfolactate phosphatase [Williamwhitmania taraxaci]|uniref:Probable 2-phosphosulfolactate phosphatase n=2 Tax=Williamwhitmania taraxaci TaxID=1640674 RepID=A0A1G6TNC8_9BACT|nr:2-phosphosulfolactate phosphatase [Williamwhitmania taraxaci]
MICWITVKLRHKSYRTIVCNTTYNMRIDIVASAAELKQERVKGKNVAVIDVLRATTVITTALMNGAKEIIPTEEVSTAFEIYSKYHSGEALLGGERNAVRIEGFHLANSPFEYMEDVVHHKTIILTTTNGTRALMGSLTANNIIVASFLNATAIATWLGEQDIDSTIVCAGSAEIYTLEDALCAGMIAKIMEERFGATLSDFAFTLKFLYEGYEGNIMSALTHCQHAQLLLSKGFRSDVEYCLQKDITDIIPRLNEGAITIER